MRLARNPFRTIAAAIIAEASVFILCAYVWGPHDTPKWVVIPYSAMMLISAILLLVGAQRPSA